jgi:hypothetical protein
MSARMKYVIFRREYSLAAVVSWITHIGLDEAVAHLTRVTHQFASHVSLFGAPETRVAHQFASHVSLFGAPEYFQNKN